MQKYQNNHRRDYIFDIALSRAWKPDALAGIRFFQETVPAPAEPDAAEQHINKRAERENVVAHQKVLEIEDGRTRPKRPKQREDVKSKQSRER